jgi:hypothetical protein
MSHAGGDEYEATLPAAAARGEIEYFFMVTDQDGLKSGYPTRRFHIAFARK